MNRRLSNSILAGVLAFASLGVACDREDERDIQEGVNKVEEEAGEAGEQIEDTVDQEVDTDGQDD